MSIKSVIAKSALASSAGAIIVTILVSGIALGWPKPVTTANCTMFTVQEVAPDHDWEKTQYWTIQGVEGKYTRGEVVSIPDTTSSTRTFVVMWHDAAGNVLDAVPSDPVVRDLAACQPATTVPPVMATLPAPEPKPVVPVINAPADPITPATPATPVASAEPTPTPEVNVGTPPAIVSGNPPSGGTLPVTGVETSTLAWWAALLVALGIICGYVRRNRNRQEVKITNK